MSNSVHPTTMAVHKALVYGAVAPMPLRPMLYGLAILGGAATAAAIGGIGIVAMGTGIGISAETLAVGGGIAAGLGARKLDKALTGGDDDVTPEDAYADDQADKAYAAADFTDPWTEDDCPF